MKVSEECDDAVVETLGVQIGQIIEASAKANPELTHKEIIIALLENVGDVLINIGCPGCRRQSKKAIERMLPVFLRHAMTEAAQGPQSSEHVH